MKTHHALLLTLVIALVFNGTLAFVIWNPHNEFSRIVLILLLMLADDITVTP